MKEEKQPVAKLDHVENMGIYLMAHGKVDGVEVQAPFIEMIVDGKCVLEGGVLDLLIRAKEDAGKPDTVMSEKPEKVEKVGMIEPAGIDLSARVAETATAFGKWEALRRKELHIL
jgi:hypothetical protein